jgi:hypothetical protein
MKYIVKGGGGGRESEEGKGERCMEVGKCDHARKTNMAETDPPVRGKHAQNTHSLYNLISL